MTVQSTLSSYTAGKYISIRDTTKISISGRSSALGPKASLKIDQMLQLGQTTSWQDCRVHLAYGLARTTYTFSQLHSIICKLLCFSFWRDSLSP